MPVPGKPAFMLRGVVSFQWRRGATVVAIGRAAHDGRAPEPRRRRPGGLQRGHLLDRLTERPLEHGSGRGEQARVVRDDPVDAHRGQLVDHPRVVDRPHVELAAALGHRAHERAATPRASAP